MPQWARSSQQGVSRRGTPPLPAQPNTLLAECIGSSGRPIWFRGLSSDIQNRATWRQIRLGHPRGSVPEWCDEGGAAAEDRAEVAEHGDVLAAGACRVRDPVRGPVPRGGLVSPPRRLPACGARSAPPPPAGQDRNRPEPVENAVPGKSQRPRRSDRHRSLRPERFPQDLENAGTASLKTARHHREEDAFPTLPTGSPRSRSYNHGKPTPRSFQSHRPTHGIPDSPARNAAHCSMRARRRSNRSVRR